MSSLTEGIETGEQLDFLRSIGCRRLQGYLFGKPVPYDKIVELINRGELRISPEFIKK
jgi:EAL domain-containing protein (putative c-di-GMP-specific phosphodiesterase class I)